MEEKKVVLVTGGAMGQGRAHAYKYAENGFNVVLADMLNPSHEAFKETIASCETKGAKVLAKKANITSTEDMEALFSSAWETFGRLDVVIANAGVINFGYTWELTDEQVEKVMDINLIGTWRTDKYAAQYMLKQGFGRIINISSTSGLYGTPQLATYCMSNVKFINDLTGKDFKSVEEMYAGVPFLEVEDIASMVYWLGTSREAGKFNGQGVPLDLGTLQ